MYYSPCVLTLVLMFSVQGIEVVARVRFSQAQYVLKEQGPTLCVDVLNEYSASSKAFSLSFSFSTSLLGMSDIGQAQRRSDFLTFSANSDRAQLCFQHVDDLIPCERDIVGTVRLNNNSGVALGQPATAEITIQDDDFINASFEKVTYTVMEGRNNNENPVFNATSAIQLQVIQAPSNGRLDVIELSLIPPTTEQSLNSRYQVVLNIQDDDIALQDPESVNLQLGISPQSSCSKVNFSPLNTTTILVHDDDAVTAELTKSEGTVNEGQRSEICVTLSRPIARELILLLRILSDTGDLQLASDRVVFAALSERLQCVEIAAVQDHVIEVEETFRIELSLETVLPLRFNTKFIIGTSIALITVQDTSSCTEVPLDPLNADSTIFVQTRRTLCFFCTRCSSDISWTLAQGSNIWTGRTGEMLRSGSNLPNIGEVLSNGTLVLINSSLAFSGSNQGTLSFNEVTPSNQNNSEYTIFIGEEPQITELRITITGAIVSFTCLYRGSPQPQLNWLANSQRIRNEDIINRIDKEGENYFQSSLFVNRTIAAMFKFTCKVSNQFGSDSSEGSFPPGNTSTSQLNMSTATSSHFSAHLFVISIILSQFL